MFPASHILYTKECIAFCLLLLFKNAIEVSAVAKQALWRCQFGLTKLFLVLYTIVKKKNFHLNQEQQCEQYEIMIIHWCIIVITGSV